MMHKHCSLKIHKVCCVSGYTYDMDICLGKNRVHAIESMTVTCATVTQLARKVEAHGHK